MSLISLVIVVLVFYPTGFAKDIAGNNMITLNLPLFHMGVPFPFWGIIRLGGALLVIWWVLWQVLKWMRAQGMLDGLFSFEWWNNWLFADFPWTADGMTVLLAKLVVYYGVLKLLIWYLLEAILVAGVPFLAGKVLPLLGLAMSSETESIIRDIVIAEALDVVGSLPLVQIQHLVILAIVILVAEHYWREERHSLRIQQRMKAQREYRYREMGNLYN